MVQLEVLLFGEADLHSWGKHPGGFGSQDVLATRINSEQIEGRYPENTYIASKDLYTLESVVSTSAVASKLHFMPLSAYLWNFSM
jgi:hypothetical protein